MADHSLSTPERGDDLTKECSRSACRQLEYSGSNSDVACSLGRPGRRRRSILERAINLLYADASREREKSAHGMPLMYGLQGQPYGEDAALEAGTRGRSGSRGCLRKSPLRSKMSKTLLAVPVMTVIVFCLLQVTNTMLGSSPLPRIGRTYTTLPSWQAPIIDTNGPTSLAATLTRNVTPLQCHSHNDYWRQVPLYEALHYGCTSIEADIWLTDERSDSKLYVGHSMASLEEDRTLRGMYIKPLLDLLDAMNHNNTSKQTKGVFETAPTQPLVLLIDIKNKPTLSFEALSTHLEPFRARNYLTYHNGTAFIPGPLTIVMTGSTPYASILAQDSTKRDILYDAPLAALPPLSAATSTSASKNPNQQNFKDYNTTTSLYASASLRKVLGNPLPFLFPWSPTPWELERIRSATRAAHARGLKVRWWDAPAWPRRMREKSWRVLQECGEDVLNVDDLEAAGGWEGW